MRIFMCGQKERAITNKWSGTSWRRKTNRKDESDFGSDTFKKLFLKVRTMYFYGHADQWGEFNGEHKFNIALYAESARVISEPAAWF